MSDILEIREFFAEGQNRDKSHVLLHITEPSTPQEIDKGYFFALAEIVNGKIEQIEQIQQMIDDLESGYYSKDETGRENGFELALEYLNRRGHHLLQHKETELHFLVGTMREGEISFAYHGRPTAAVIYQGQHGYEQMPVIDYDAEKPEEQLFSALMQGKIQTNDFFYIATPHVLEHLPDSQIKKIITSRSAQQSSLYIEKVLTDLRNELSFGGVIFHLVQENKLPKTGKLPFHLKRGSADSLNQFMSTQQSTNETLNPPLLSQATQTIKKYLTNDQKTVKTNHDKLDQKIVASTLVNKNQEETNFRPRAKIKSSNSLFNTILIGLGRIIFLIAKIIFFIFQQIIILLRNILFGLFFLITNKDGKRHQIITNWRSNINQKWQFIATLPLISKILLIITIVFTVAFIGSIIFLKIKKNQELAVQYYQNQIQEVIDKKNAADAGLIYGDDSRALNLLKEANELIATLPDKTKEQKTKIQELTAELETSLTKVRKIYTVSSTLLADLSTTNQTEIQTTHIANLENKLIAYGDSDQHHYIIEKENGNISVKTHESNPIIVSATTPKENDFVLFLTGSTTVATMDKDTFVLSAKDISFSKTNTGLTDLFVYNRRVYSLDPNNNQIYRHSPTQTGYDQGKAWIDSDVDLTGGTSLAIDGDLWILKKNGEILKFTNGEKQPFEVLGLDPILTEPTQIWTYTNTNNIYVLEPTNNRIVILNKEGKLIKQITSAEWQKPTGMVIDEEKNLIYVLDSNKIYAQKI